MKKRYGFTLVELLTVIAIILLLVSIFLPSLQNVKRQSNLVRGQYNPQNDIIISPIELVFVSPDGISGRPVIVGTFLVWGGLSENPDPYGSYSLNLWICEDRYISDTCWISHNCINQSEDNSKWILTDSLVNKIEQKQSAR
jgi:prepilin-type N-terminal cleavage/methylation domain-containing protein